MRRIITVTLNPTIDRVIEVPGFRVGEHLKGRLALRTPAGKSLNVSRALASLGVPSITMGFVGKDAEAEFDRAAQAMRAVPRFTPIAGNTRENITIVDPQAPSETHIRDAGPQVDEAEIACLEAALRETAGDRPVMVFTGSLAPGLGDERFGRMLDTCIDRGADVVVDTSGPALRAAAARPLYAIKPNLAELSELAGVPLQTDDDILAAGEQLARSIGVVAVTLGERGACCFAQEERWRASAELPPPEIRSTVGCGDAFLAGLIAALFIGQGSVEHALKQAVSVAAASALSPLPAHFTEDDVARIASTVKSHRR